MEIYIRVDEDGFGEVGWLYKDEYQYYLVDHVFDKWGEECATPFKTVKEAKRWGQEAKQLMFQDGAVGNIHLSYYRLVRGKFVKTEFTKDNKIKK